MKRSHTSASSCVSIGVLWDCFSSFIPLWNSELEYSEHALTSAWFGRRGCFDTPDSLIARRLCHSGWHSAATYRPGGPDTQHNVIALSLII
jgi:hypothetical protein